MGHRFSADGWQSGIWLGASIHWNFPAKSLLRLHPLLHLPIKLA